MKSSGSLQVVIPALNGAELIDQDWMDIDSNERTT